MASITIGTNNVNIQLAILPGYFERRSELIKTSNFSVIEAGWEKSSSFDLFYFIFVFFGISLLVKRPQRLAKLIEERNKKIKEYYEKANNIKGSGKKSGLSVKTNLRGQGDNENNIIQFRPPKKPE